jgi:hypothetical protein
MGGISGAETAYPSKAPEFSPGFQRVRVTQSLAFFVVICRSLSFYFWPLCSLSFFNLWILITALLSSNSSQTVSMAT